MLDTFKNKFIGNRAFYSKVMKVGVPIMIQNGITNFVSLLDNIMVGQCGTEAMSGVAIVNQLMFVYFLCMFGTSAGGGIFTAQYYGIKDDEGIRYTVRYKFWLMSLLSVAVVVVAVIFGSDLIGLYLNGENEGGDLALTLQYGLDYMYIVLVSIPAIMVSMVYSSTLRECGETILPMKAGVVAVFVNLSFNWLLIYGNLGFPELGVKGAAIATVISRYVEVLIVVVWTHTHREQNTFVSGLWSTMKLPLRLGVKFFLTGAPLLVNETMWALGIATLTQSYSTRGLNVVAGQNIANTIYNLFNIAFIAMGDAVAIIVGQLLGAGDMKRAKDEDNKIIAFSVFISVVIGGVMLATSWVFPQLYNTSDEAKLIATQFMIVQALAMPQNGFLHTTYFTLRSGGRTIITFLFDSAFTWAVSVPAAFLLTRYTDLYVIWVFAIVNVLDWIKCIVGYVLLKNNMWMNNIVS
ncbi:MAG: MATE family efflux transporter [Lachnospiraceae bacterium]|nr:MATE family efflux transporter [Lachnospiraceae bacterium]